MQKNLKEGGADCALKSDFATASTALSHIYLDPYKRESQRSVI